MTNAYYRFANVQCAEIYGLDGTRFRCVDDEWLAVDFCNSEEDALIIAALEALFLSGSVDQMLNGTLVQ